MRVDLARMSDGIPTMNFEMTAMRQHPAGHVQEHDDTEHRGF
jgi:hypothetical protein